MAAQLDLRFASGIPEGLDETWLAARKRVYRESDTLFGSLISDSLIHDVGLLGNGLIRNQFENPLYHYLTVIEMLLDWQEEWPASIITDCPHLGEAIRQIAEGRDTDIICQPDRQQSPAGYAIARIKGLLRLCVELVLARLGPRTLSREDPPAYLLDCYLSPTADSHDRYYPGLFDILDEGIASRCWFVPNLYGYRLSAMAPVFRDTTRWDRQWVYKERYLSLGDAFWIFRQTGRIRRSVDPSAQYRGLPIGGMVNRLMGDSFYLFSVIGALKSVRFFRALKARGIEPAGTLCWHENKSLGRGWCKGISENYPATPRTGNLSILLPSRALNIIPAELERGVVPDALAAVGDLDVLRASCPPGFPVTAAPAFRFSWLFSTQPPGNNSAPPVTGPLRVMVALPSKGIGYPLIRQIVEQLRSVEPPVCTFLKAHPSVRLDEDQLGHRFGNEADGLVDATTDRMQDLLDRVDVAITWPRSSVPYECVCRGVYTIVIAAREDALDTAGLEALPTELMSIISRPSDIPERIGKARETSVDVRREIGLDCRQRLFREPDAETVGNLFPG